MVGMRRKESIGSPITVFIRVRKVVYVEEKGEVA